MKFLLEISGNLVDAPGNFLISSVIFAHQKAIFTILACVHVGRQVMTDPDLNVACDVLLFKIDVRAGYWGMYNFYKMQVINTLSCSDILVLEFVLVVVFI